MQQLNAKLTDVRHNQDASRVYLTFLSMDVGGKFQHSIPADEFNGFKVGDDLRLDVELVARDSVRTINTAQGQRQIVSNDLSAQVVKMDYQKGAPGA